MYSVSEEYKAALKKKIITDRISGKVTLSDGNTINISDKVLVAGSLKITHELCGSYKIGTFNLGCLKIGIYDSDALLHDFSGATVEPVYEIKTTAGWEKVPLGSFRADGKYVKRKRNAVYLTAYDNGTLFDCPPENWLRFCKYNAEGFLTRICRQCGVTFGGIAEGLPNTDVELSLADTQVQTCRDAVMWCAAILCGYAVIDRSGALRIIPARYDTSADEPLDIVVDKIVTAEERKSIYVTDTRAYIKSLTAYCGQNIKNYTSSVVQTDAQAAPATYALAKNPLIPKTLSDDEYDGINEAWLGFIHGFKQRGITAEIYGDPALDAGDVLRCSGGDIDQRRSIVGLVTKQEWRYRKYHSIICAAPDLIFDEQQTATSSVSVRNQAEKRIDAAQTAAGEGLTKKENEFSLSEATLSGNLGGVRIDGEWGISVGGLGPGGERRVLLKYAKMSQENNHKNVGGIRLGEGLVNISETEDSDTNTGGYFVRTAVYIGQGMEYEDVPENDTYPRAKKIRPKLGAGLKFDSDNALAVDADAVGGNYTAGAGVKITGNEIALRPAGSALGGVKAGKGVTIAADGTLDATVSGGDYSAGGGIEITEGEEGENPKIGVKCGEGCEINESGELVTVPNIQNAVIITEVDAKYLLHNYTQTEYIAGNKIGYAGAQNQIVINGYIAVKSGNQLSAPLYQSAKLTSVSGTNVTEHNITTELASVSSSGGYIYKILDNDTVCGSYTTYDPATIGFAITWGTIYSAAEAAPYGYAYLEFFAVHKPTAAAEVNSATLITKISRINYNFASEAEYNAAVGLTYEPVMLTQVTDSTAIV